MREKLLELVGEKGDLPPLPDVLINLENRINDPDSDIENIAGLIEMDPVLSGRLIKLANSVFFGGARDEVSDISSALMRLGMKMVLDLVYTSELPKLFKKSKSFDQLQFWKHSLAVGILTRSLARLAPSSKVDEDTGYLCGLMHDVGILVFDFLIPREYAVFVQNIRSSEEALEKMEMEEFGISHGDLGGQFIRKWWPVPEHVADAVQKHHDPISTNLESMDNAGMVHWANVIAIENGIPNGISGVVCPEDTGLLETLGLSSEDMDTIIGDTHEGLVRAEAMLTG